MSTRGSYGFIYNDEINLIFNHWDSYPDGIGFEILEFIRKLNIEDKWDLFKSQVSKFNFLSDPTNEDYDEAENIEHKPKEFLFNILNGQLKKYPLSNNFIKDSLFCEYAYIMNLDNMTLEFYLGFQKKPQPGNRFGVSIERGYYPCRLVAIFDMINDDLLYISDKMLEYSRSEEEMKDDPSVDKFFRKKKLEIINNYGRII